MDAARPVNGLTDITLAHPASVRFPPIAVI